MGVFIGRSPLPETRLNRVTFALQDRSWNLSVSGGAVLVFWARPGDDTNQSVDGFEVSDVCGGTGIKALKTNNA